jgi:hypothetical protein
VAKQKDDLRQQVIDSLDIEQAYREMGLVLVGDKPRPNGKMEAYSMARPDERKPSAFIDVNTGLYGDKGPGGESSLSLFDFAVKYGGFHDFKAAFEHFANVAGVETKRHRKKRTEDPDEKLEFEEWNVGNDIRARVWTERFKKGTSLDALKAAGARIAYYPCYKDKKTGEKKRGKNKVIALPCYGEAGAAVEPVAWVLWDLGGRGLRVYRGGGRDDFDLVKMKSIGPTAGAMMNKSALDRLAGDRAGIELVIKTAGPSDMLAMMTAIPPEKRDSILVVCNASGETGEVLPHNVELFTGLRAAVMHDADQAGELGALKWCVPLSGAASEVRHVRLPYEITPKSGKDFRNYVVDDGKTFEDWMALLDQTQPFEPPASPGHDDATPDDSTVVERQMVSMIQLDVLGEMQRGGVKVFSEFHRKAMVIPNVGRMSYEDLLQIAGPRVKQFVMLSSKDEKPGMVALPKMREAIALLGGFKQIGDQTEIGAGCWAGVTDEGDDQQSVVVVGNGEGAQWNGSTLEYINHPRCQGHLLDFESVYKPWYDYPTLKRYIEQCDQRFANDTLHEAIRLFNLFRWTHSAGPITATGLALATWVQSLWDWRPQIAIIGPSNAGKTTLFNMLEKMYGNLAMKSSSSSAAGIRQALKTSSQVVLCDEFENSRYRQEILEMLRVSGRGDKILRGTTNQRGQGFGLRHIVWVAAIEVGLSRAPDRNRFIILELEGISEDDRKSFRPPTSAEIADLGQRMLAVAIRNIYAARPLAAELKERTFPNIDARVIESYAVPASILATIQGLGLDDAGELMSKMLVGVDRDQGKIDDSVDLMEAILSAHIDIGRGARLSAAQLIDGVLNDDRDAGMYESALAKCGLRIGPMEGHGNQYSDGHGPRCLIVAHTAVRKHLLKGTPWEAQSIEQVLKRIKGAKYTKRRVGAQNLRSVLIGLDLLEREFLGRRADERSAIMC